VTVGQSEVAKALEGAHASAMRKFKQEQIELRDRIVEAMKEAEEVNDSSYLLQLVKEVAPRRSSAHAAPPWPPLV
jgi:hypothetical protein